MICPRCETQNPAAARFCMSCGLALGSLCTNCHHELQPGARFCMHCGQPARRTSPADDRRLARLAAGAPTQLADKVRESALSGERRVVTVLFIDVVGSTALAEQLDVETWSAIMNRAFDRISPIIYRHEGTIAQLVGDAMWAFFGAPVAHEDDPQRAVHAALQAMEKAREIAEEVRAEHGVDFAMRACLNTGTVIVGPVGSDMRYSFAASGDAVNLASRLKFAAGPMEVLVTENTRGFVTPAFQCSELGLIDVWGRSEPVSACRVHGPKSKVPAVRGRAPALSGLVGRGEQLTRLARLTEAVMAGLGRALLLVGEPGMGKTRLIHEWRTVTSATPRGKTIKWLDGRCLSYRQDSAYHLLNDLVRSVAGVSGGADDAEVCACLERTAGELLPHEELAGVLPFLKHLLSVELDGQEQELLQHLDPPAIQAQYATATGQLLRALSERRPIVMVLDDLQWADPASIAVLLRLLPLASVAPLLICLIIRPERETPGWQLVTAARDILGSGLTELALSPLSASDSLQLAANVLGAGNLPSPVQALILEKAEGNPLFVEELVRTLIDRGVLTRVDGRWVPAPGIGRLKIPGNLQGLLLARIDRLADAPKVILRVASVIGRRFSVEVLRQVLRGREGEQELLSHLSALESAGLIRFDQTETELAYTFRHALVLQTAYESLLRSDRRQLHLAVGEVLEQSHPDRLDSRELAPVLGEHFTEGGDRVRALRYMSLAGQAALASYANSEAESYFRIGLELADSSDQRAPLLVGLGRALSRLTRFIEAIETWREGIDLYLEQGPEGIDQVAYLYGRSARAAWAGGDTPGGLKLCQEGLGVIRGAPDGPGIAMLAHEAARAYLFNGQAEMARPLCRQAGQMAEQLGVVRVQADAMATMGLLLGHSPADAIAALEEAIELAESAGLLSQAARAHNNLASTLATDVDVQAALHHYRRATALHEQRGDIGGQLLSLGGVTEALLRLGRMAEVEVTLETMSELLRVVAEPGPNALIYLASRGALLRYQGDLGAAIGELHVLQEEARRRDDLYMLIEAGTLLADALLESLLLEDRLGADARLGTGEQRQEEIAAALEEVIQICDQWHWTGIWARSIQSALLIYQGSNEAAGRLLAVAKDRSSIRPSFSDKGWLALGEARLAAAELRLSDAILAYEEAAAIFSQLGMHWWRARTLYDWAEAYLACGEPTDMERARTLLGEARAAFEEMGVGTPAELVRERQRELRAETYAQALAHQAAVQELADAGRIQEGLLPEKVPAIEGWQLSATLEPAKETAGDFYDFIELSDGRWGIVVADVADKGAGAALYMSLSRSLIRTYASDHTARPEKALGLVNRRILTDTHGDMFVTVFYGVLDPETGRLDYCNAGHNPPYLFSDPRGDGELPLTRTGMPLGIQADAAWEQGSVQIEPGGALLLYSDGATEAQDTAGELYGEERLLEAAHSALGGSAEAMQGSLLDSVHNFVGTAPRSDDLTLMILARDA